ncbi:MAG: TIGR03960 family B12-binding radical SAM protein [Candidatus Saccharicenans sp.]|nr:TIGR03960 family B12-binding radical SAM protein [Candidatus Saccharicenans sp.]
MRPFRKIQPVDRKTLEILLRRVQKPGRYIGGEWNQIKKNPDETKVRVALAFPEVYEIGLSYLGQRILYSILNRRPDVLAERVYAPWPDLEAELRRSKIPLFTLENKIPLDQFDLVGFSLLYELNHTNLLNILELGGIPLLSRERQPHDPLIIAGGPAALNPEPLADFIDIFAFGDGEQLILEIVDRYLEARDSAGSREELIRSFSDIKGIYLPAFYRPAAVPGSSLLVPKPQPGFPERIEKRVVFPLEKAQVPDKFVVPNIQSVFDRLQVEVARGCPQNCRFCQAAVLYFPYRLRPAAQAVDVIWQGLKDTGYDDVSLNALSVGDYPFLEQMIETLMPVLEEEKISISLPSLRPGGLSRKVVEEIVRVRKTGFTLVPEAGTERLRRVINKKISDEELFRAAQYAFENGWRLLKLYFMIGLPTETAEDLKAIINLIQQLIELGRKIIKATPGINLSVSPFIPKPHTPFQWLPMEDEDRLQKKQEYIKSNIGRWKKVELKEHRIKASILEAVFSRGDRRLGAALLEAYRLGARFDGWLDQFDFNLWLKAFELSGIDYKIYLRSISPEAELPWDVVNVGLKKNYLKEELKAALEAKYTEGCPERDCARCLACDRPEIKSALSDIKNISAISLNSGHKARKIDVPVRYRAIYEKTGPARFISHNDLLNQLERGLRRAGVKMAFSRGFHPKMLITHGPALPLGMQAKAEAMEFRALEIIEPDDFLKEINACLPEGLRFRGLMSCFSSCRPLIQDIAQTVYSLDLSDPEAPSPEELQKRLAPESLEQLSHLYQEKVRAEINHDGNKLWLFIDFHPEKPVRVQEVVENLLGWQNAVYALTREYLVFSDGRKSSELISQ